MQSTNENLIFWKLENPITEHLQYRQFQNHEMLTRKIFRPTKKNFRPTKTPRKKNGHSWLFTTNARYHNGTWPKSPALMCHPWHLAHCSLSTLRCLIKGGCGGGRGGQNKWRGLEIFVKFNRWWAKINGGTGMEFQKIRQYR